MSVGLLKKSFFICLCDYGRIIEKEWQRLSDFSILLLLDTEFITSSLLLNMLMKNFIHDSQIRY